MAERGIDDLLPAVYERLRAVARRAMTGERGDHTLGATALVHEAYIRLLEHKHPWAGEAHFVAAAAEAIRRTLIDHARSRGARKRGGGTPRASLESLREIPATAAEIEDDAVILALDEAISRLEVSDERCAAVVRLRFYGGLSVEQAGLALGMSPRTAAREWTYARAKLFRMLTQAEPALQTASSRDRHAEETDAGQ